MVYLIQTIQILKGRDKSASSKFDLLAKVIGLGSLISIKKKWFTQVIIKNKGSPTFMLRQFLQNMGYYQELDKWLISHLNII